MSFGNEPLVSPTPCLSADSNSPHNQSCQLVFSYFPGFTICLHLRTSHPQTYETHYFCIYSPHPPWPNMFSFHLKKEWKRNNTGCSYSIIIIHICSPAQQKYLSSTHRPPGMQEWHVIFILASLVFHLCKQTWFCCVVFFYIKRTESYFRIKINDLGPGSVVRASSLYSKVAVQSLVRACTIINQWMHQ